MTEHVRRNYRNHRKATWVFAIAVMVAIAAFVIPIASGAAKTYTMLFPSTGAVTPTPPLSGNTTSQTLCSGSTYTVKVAITNTTSSQQLGSADVTFPANVTLSSASSSTGLSSTSGNVVSLRQLSLQKNGVVTITAALGTGGAATPAQAITARVKQSNDFSDSGSNPNANGFDNPVFPTIQVQACTATITGRVYHDRDQSGAFAVDPSSPTSDIAKQGWKVTLQRQTGPSTYTNVDSDFSDASGMYSVEGQIGSNFRLCVTAPNPPDSSSRWGTRAVTGITLVAGCVPGITPSSGTSQGLSVLNLPAAGATGQDFAVVPITAPDFQAGSTSGTQDGNYVVTAAGNTTKPAQNYVQETWTDNGHPYYVFAPINGQINPCSDPSHCIYLLEHISGSIKQSALGPTHQVVLVYDDTEPFQTFTPMPYCLQDPRPATGNSLLASGVLPAGATSCIVEGHQKVDGDGTVANASVDFEFFVYTSHDGSRGGT
jgi:hypothetical protein